jgi:hypothetical protein
LFSGAQNRDDFFTKWVQQSAIKLFLLKFLEPDDKKGETSVGNPVDETIHQH